MKTALRLCLAFLTFASITRADTPALKADAHQIYISSKFVEISEKKTNPPSGTPLPAPLDGVRKVPARVGTLSDPQFQVLIRALSQRKGIDLMSAPSVTTRSGQKATVEVVREFAYKDKAGKPATKNCGVSLTVIPKVKEDFQIALDLIPDVTEFIEFKKHPDGWKEPRFNVRRTLANVVLSSGETTVLELNSRTDTQVVEDADESGHIISSETVFYHRRLFVFVTACLVRPVAAKR